MTTLAFGAPTDMHASSLENMRKCYRRYVEGGALEALERVVVLDIGGADVNGSYRPIFGDPRFHYIAADVAEGPGVSLVLDDPYRLPLDDCSVDVILCGQTLEHCEFFWLAFAEMIRVLKRGGYLFLIAPSAGPEHRYPVDCYRFYPDAYRALAKHANCQLLDVWRDERGPWCDLVGVFARHGLPAGVESPSDQEEPAKPQFEAGPGTPEEEAVPSATPSRDVLADIHRQLQPGLYLEIGVRHGASLALANCSAVAVDPMPDLRAEPHPSTTLFRMSSDDFFEREARTCLRSPPDLVLIDGMHLFEFALRDFMNVERLAAPHTLVVIDDVFPNHPAQAERRRRTRVWTGDVWKLHACLAQHRPDLFMVALDTAPAGMLLVAGLDPTNRTLWAGYNKIVRAFSGQTAPSETVLAREGASRSLDLLGPVLESLAHARDGRSSRSELVLALRRACAQSRCNDEGFHG